jgi:PST family polysaccharide transporter
LLLGPGGIGLEAVYDSVVTLARTLFDLGISTSGVRQIAVAAGTGDRRAIAGTFATLRRTCLVLGLLATAVVFSFRESLSRIAFGNTDHAWDIGLLSVILFFGAVSGGQAALIQGTRRIGDLARMNIIGALAGAVLSIPLVYFFGRGGVALYMVVAAGAMVLASNHYAGRIALEPVKVPFEAVKREAASLFRLGIVFMASGLMATGALFLLRILITRQDGLEGAGQFQAASALSMVYVNFVLQAMGTDFYPRLTAVANDDERCNQLVNEQAEISILLALPGVLGTIAVAPWVILAFYSSRFNEAAAILCWQVAGMVLRVNSWPMGFIILAKGRAATLFWTDLAAYSLYLGLGWAGLRWIGLPAVGMAFAGLYLFHWVMIYWVVRRMTGFSWSAANTRLSLLGVTAVTFTLAARLATPEPWATLIGVLISLGVGLYCLSLLLKHIGGTRITAALQKFTRRTNRAAPVEQTA